ncbi:MAG TPA: tRNA pseudouridine(38-40) synthase TruA [Terriglobales bacterium]|nr:tRNA pseudouridine(38-40) synthase TruA [Terriglobales bacterium]
MNIKLTLEYDGTLYHGWQIQPTDKTIQSVLERAVSTFLGKPTCVTGSGRTDAGVHALGQVANFFSDKVFTPHRIRRALNALTPDDIAIKDVEIVADSFDARRDGRSRVYDYHILNRLTASPFYLNRAWHLHEPLDVEAMRRAIPCLIGEHDFSSFRAAGCEAGHPVRKVYRTSLNQRDELLIYTIEATAFLRHMVRNIVGTLVEVGRGARTAESFNELLKMRDRTKAGPTAPPHGLFLVEVKY